MKKSNILKLVLFLAVLFVVACTPKANNNKNVETANAETGIQFVETDWNKVKLMAKKQNKLIFLDAYAVWCGPCKMLKRNTFPNKEAGDFFNKHFINVAIDMEKGEGLMLAQKFNVNAYPTLIIADAEGNAITITKGYIGADDLIKFGMHGVDEYKK